MMFLLSFQGAEQLAEGGGGERRFHHCGLFPHFHHRPPGLAAARVWNTKHAPHLNVRGEFLAENEQAEN